MSEIVARIASASRTWEVLSWSGDTMQLAGEYGLFDSDIGNAVRFGIQLVDCFDPAFAKKWEKTAQRIEEKRARQRAAETASADG